MTTCDLSAPLLLAAADATGTRLASLTILVVLQIVTFQFLFLRMSRILPRQLLGSDTGPESVAPVVARYRHGLGQGRRVLGVLLIAAALVVATVAPLAEAGHRKLGLAVVSLLSTGVMVVGYVRDTRRIYMLRKLLEPAGAHTASLERRTLAAFYPLRLEALPVVVLALTLALTVWLWPVGSGTGTVRILALPAVQLAFLAVSRLFAGWLAGRRWPVAQGALAQADDPAAVLAQSRDLRRRDLRDFVFARAFIALLMGVWQWQWLHRWRGETLPAWLGLADDAVVVVLLGIFVAVLLTLPGYRGSS
jgi:hypothetical protein